MSCRSPFIPWFTPAGAGVASFTFQVQDDGGVANSGADLDATPNTLTLNIGPGAPPSLAEPSQPLPRGGTAGANTVTGSLGADSMSGLGGDDSISGARAEDFVRGDAGADYLHRNQGSDTLQGGEGDDLLRGGQGNDLIDGGAGNDWLSGDRGEDTLTGGDGADTFHVFAGPGADRVTDFNAAAGDRVQLAPGQAYTAAQVGADVVVTVDDARLTLAGVQLTSLGSGWIF
jgi:serralysin